jgi:hypothetical protein
VSAVDTATIRRAAQRMRTDGWHVMGPIADLLTDIADGQDEQTILDGALTVATAYDADPGELPESAA